MDNPKIAAYCKSIDNAFLDYTMNGCSEQELCRRVASSLNKISEAVNLKKEFSVIIINGKNDFCGIKVYPDPAYMTKIYSGIDETSSLDFCKGWLVNVKRYVVEIDTNCFNKHMINFTNKELTAMLLHEMGHVAFSSTIPELIYNSYRIHREEIRLGNKSAVRIAQQIFYAVPTLIACGMHVIRTGKDGRKEEYIADKIFGIDSYKPHLYSAIDKILRTYGTSVYTNEDDQKKIVGHLIEQSNVSIKELSTRRRIIKDELLYQSANTHSKTLRKAYLEIMSKLGIGFTDRYTNATIATEALLDSIECGDISLNGILNKVRMVDNQNSLLSAVECAFNDCKCNCCKKYNCKLPTKYDFELIQLGIGSIRTNLDKVAILDELYKLQEKIEAYKDYAITNGIYDISKFNIDQCEACLKRLIDGANEADVSVVRFSDFLKYPEEYTNN